MIEIGGQLGDHRRGPAPQPIGGLARAQGLEVKPGGAERPCVGRVGRRRTGILLVGADVDQSLAQHLVAQGGILAGGRLVLEAAQPCAGLGSHAGGVILDLPHGRQGREPADGILRLFAGLIEQGRAPAQQPLHRGGPSLLKPGDVGERRAAQAHHRQQRRGQGHRAAAPRPLDDARASLLGAGGLGHPGPLGRLGRALGLLGAGGLGGAGQLGGAQPLLHAGQVQR